MSRLRRAGVTTDVAIGALLALGFALVVFVATGGTDLGPNTWVQIALLVVAAGCAVTLVLVRPRGRVEGAAALGLFAALAALTYLSIAWSVQPATSWTEANRTLSYLAAFGAAVALARLVPARWPALVGAIGTVAVVACGYGLLSKVFPGSLDAADTFGRLRVPFDYWNATGLMAAMGLPVCLWTGARSGSGRVLRALAVPAIAIVTTALILSYSRGAMLAALVGLACWFVLVPLRLRATLVLALGAAAGAIASAWALSHHAITHDNQALAARTAAGHDFGLVLLIVVILSAIAGWAVTIGMERVALSGRLRHRIGTALVVLVALVPVAVVLGAAASSRGLTGEASHAWHTLTSSSLSAQPGNTAARLGSLGNSRSIYWHEGLQVGEHAPLAGVGAGGFDTARTRYTTNSTVFAHAHSYLIETFADLGLIGLAVSLALLVLWARACRRTLAPATGVERSSPERIGLITLLSVVVIFGVSSLIDWTWFVPGVAVPALAAAGWLAGRGPIAGRSAQEAPARTDRTVGARALTPGRLAGATGIGVALLVAGFFVWQPLHSADSFGSAISAMGRGDAAAALADARSAADSDPVSVDPLWEQSAIYSALGKATAARSKLVQATSLQPENPQTWLQLGEFDLQAHQVRLAVGELATAHRLDLASGPISQQLGLVRRVL
ncbi:MAG: O-antigen ligase family protein [Solirubrobacteraceae bacterium]